ncbi:MAG TPA: ferredoxin family protein [Solirubrobacteraceae bacterium]|jgi:NAD-dependent dihydropyrimidine dehydrogenase PreA subunit|nr:ferredoxin family protein [Solirubrobacteraceae bacterium]
MRKDGTFIAVEVDNSVASDPAVAAKLAEVCPVDIFAAAGDDGVEIVEQNLDECVLCRLCLNAVDSDPTHPVRVLKLYEDGAAL